MKFRIRIYGPKGMPSKVFLFSAIEFDLWFTAWMESKDLKAGSSFSAEAVV